MPWAGPAYASSRRLGVYACAEQQRDRHRAAGAHTQSLARFVGKVRIDLYVQTDPVVTTDHTKHVDNRIEAKSRGVISSCGHETISLLDIGFVLEFFRSRIRDLRAAAKSGQARPARNRLTVAVSVARYNRSGNLARRFEQGLQSASCLVTIRHSAAMFETQISVTGGRTQEIRLPQASRSKALDALQKHVERLSARLLVPFPVFGAPGTDLIHGDNGDREADRLELLPGRAHPW